MVELLPYNRTAPSKSQASTEMKTALSRLTHSASAFPIHSETIFHSAHCWFSQNITYQKLGSVKEITQTAAFPIHFEIIFYRAHCWFFTKNSPVSIVVKQYCFGENLTVCNGANWQHMQGVWSQWSGL